MTHFFQIRRNCSDNGIAESTSHSHTMIYTCNDCKTSRRIPAPPTLSIDGVSKTTTPPTQSSLTDNADEAAMVVSTDANVTIETLPLGGRKKRKKEAVPRRPPLFARDVGHVVFCGNERLPDLEPGQGNGIYIT